jgi:hypothetical protein
MKIKDKTMKLIGQTLFTLVNFGVSWKLIFSNNLSGSLPVEHLAIMMFYVVVILFGSCQLISALSDYLRLYRQELIVPISSKSKLASVLIAVFVVVSSLIAFMLIGQYYSVLFMIYIFFLVLIMLIDSRVKEGLYTHDLIHDGKMYHLKDIKSIQVDESKIVMIFEKKILWFKVISEVKIYSDLEGLLKLERSLNIHKQVS